MCVCVCARMPGQVAILQTLSRQKLRCPSVTALVLPQIHLTENHLDYVAQLSLLACQILARAYFAAQALLSLLSIAASRTRPRHQQRQRLLVQEEQRCFLPLLYALGAAGLGAPVAEVPLLHLHKAIRCSSLVIQWHLMTHHTKTCSSSTAAFIQTIVHRPACVRLRNSCTLLPSLSCASPHSQ